MDYKKIYDKIIIKAQGRILDGEYYETHHILPKSLGGNDSKENLVKLTAREHFICHFLLAKMYSTESFEWYKMNHAFLIMKAYSLNQNRYFNSHLYESLKTNFSKVMSNSQSGQHNSQFGKKWIYNDDLKISKKIDTMITVPEGWLLGRKINWDINDKVCENCGSTFSSNKRNVLCSVKCKHEFRVKKTELKYKSTIGEISKNFTIDYSDLYKNTDFIKELVRCKIPINQILKYFNYCDSGGNYNTIKFIISR